MKVGKEEVIGCLTALETWLKDRREETLCRMECAHRPHPQAGRNCAWGYDEHVRSRRRKSLSNFKSEMGPASLEFFHLRLCAKNFVPAIPVIEVLGADNPSLVTAVREGNPNRKGTQGARSYRTGFHDDQTRRGNHCRAKIARRPGRGAEEGCLERARRETVHLSDHRSMLVRCSLRASAFASYSAGPSARCGSWPTLPRVATAFSRQAWMRATISTSRAKGPAAQTVPCHQHSMRNSVKLSTTSRPSWSLPD